MFRLFPAVRNRQKYWYKKAAESGFRQKEKDRL
ncbi:hypothetical protein H9L42_02100 [Mogibacterium sp. BX12]|uniref:Uncharacterized protein n=1 Tax=Zhenpiania hominis TaxID=2763644 RepID=A0A923NKB2_9FIRM|nr:hypothetical protein [Zhenpiania hominis]